MAEQGPTNFGAPLSEKKFSAWFFFGTFFSHQCHKYKNGIAQQRKVKQKNPNICKAPLNTKYIF